MEELLVPIEWVAIIFFVVSMAYSSVGLGGGSSYTALLMLFGASQVAIPSISLTLNLLVTTVGSYHFLSHRHGRWRLILPFLLGSIPFAYLGGTLMLPAAAFRWILLLSLLFVCMRIYMWRTVSFQLDLDRRQKLVLAVVCGMLLGFVAGTVGIGGGIYLVPLIIILGLGSPKEAAATGAIFIWVNSLTGLTARYQSNLIDLEGIVPIAIAALVGGALGSWLGSVKLEPKKMERVLGLVVAVAAVTLGKRLMLL